jgi:hypothetical protein
MPALLQCTKCKATAFARILEDDWSINSFVYDEDDLEWTTDGTAEAELCTHEENEVIEVEPDYDDPRWDG